MASESDIATNALDSTIKVTEWVYMIGDIASVIAVLITAFVAWKVSQGQKKLSQRQLIIPIWDYLSSIKDIDAKKPIPVDVINLANTLELVAICCEGGMVDKDVIMRTFKDNIIKHTDQILAITHKIDSLGKNGEQIMSENRAAYQLYQALKHENLSEGQLNK